MVISFFFFPRDEIKSKEERKKPTETPAEKGAAWRLNKGKRRYKTKAE